MMVGQADNWARRGQAAKAARVAALLLLAATAAGCQTARETTAAADLYENDYRLRHPISITEKDNKIVLFVGTNRGGLNPTQRAEVMAFASTWKKDSTGGIIVDVPTGTSNARAAADAAHEVQSLLAAADVPAHAYRIRPYRPADGALAPIRLNYPRIAAAAGPCGLWPYDLGPGAGAIHLENKPYWNLGCATQRNLAAMVDEPADLVQPRGEIAAYTPRRQTVVDKYRKGDSTATVYPNPKQGRISDVGQ